MKRVLVIGLAFAVCVAALGAAGALTFNDLTDQEQVRFIQRNVDKWTTARKLLKEKQDLEADLLSVDTADWTDEERADFVVEGRSGRRRLGRRLIAVLQKNITPTAVRNLPK